MKKIALVLTLLALSSSGAFAHALWIETASTGKKGQAQEVKIFFGEYEENEPDSAAKWFSNLKDFSLVLTAPNGATKILTTVADVHCFKASFTPDQDGTYTLSVVHEVKAIYEHAKIEYYAFTHVAVGNAPKINLTYPANALFTIRPSAAVVKAGASVPHQVLYNKVPFATQKLTVVDTERKKQEPVTDANGKFDFKPAQKGNYFLEAFKEEATPGELDGKKYDKVWHVVTYFVQAQ
ncbi:DUF4198 domain-containing protein [Pedobacter sp. KR3-3]|uniref:DUF4198 domain-containing protein n=1 Tax=Pedobacter albus TaxID=3113905 RepID=A0ABU7IAU4_9SPHI|nr:DUF4198 domain-containing protein [Pedobacter sp. KR3-3]MEE1946587.1 DUF4198 domain-containing protein [Pedobacter sp. KR3-3]